MISFLTIGIFFCLHFVSCPCKAARTTKAQYTTISGTDKTDSTKSSCGSEWYLFIVFFVSGIIIGLFIQSYIVHVVFSRRRSRNLKSQSNREPEMRAEAEDDDAVYQDLDLTEMNSEDNYQSLTVNSCDDEEAYEYDNTYTELNEIRDVEENYQTLIG